MNLTKIKPIENGNPKVREIPTCQLCLTECCPSKLLTCPVNNNCDYVMCFKCIGKEKQRLIELNEEMTRMICPACRIKWPFNDSIKAEQVRIGRIRDCPYYCICITSDNCKCRISCVKNLNHPLHASLFLQRIIQLAIEKRRKYTRNLIFLKKKFLEQKILIRVLQATLIAFCFRAIFDIYVCAIPEVDINTSKNDWCLPFFTYWFLILAVVGFLFVVFTVFAILFGVLILISFVQCICGFDEDDI